MSRMARAFLAALALAGTACMTDASSPVQSLAVAWDPNSQHYALAPVKLSTLTSLRHVRGGAGIITVGGTVQANTAAIHDKAATVEKLRKTLVTQAPSDADVSFSLSGGIAYPEDADSLQLITAFYNLEQARAAFGGWGQQNLPPAAVVAGASISSDSGQSPLTNAEIFYAPLATHYLPTPSSRTEIPVAENLGAMGHSLMHQAIALFAWANAPVPPTDQGPSRDPDWNSAKHVAASMTEGLADFMGAMVTGDTHWLDHSDQQDAAARALDQRWCSKPEMLQALPLSDDTTPYNPYSLGTVLAAALWTAGQATSPDALAQGALASLPGIKAAAATGSGKISVSDVLNAIVAATSSDSRPALCGILLDRFAQVAVTDLPSCAGGVVKPADRCACDNPGAPGCG